MRQSTSHDALSQGACPTLYPWIALGTRVLCGLFFFHAGWSKFSTEGWSAAAYLQQSTGPFAGWFQSLAGNSLVDQLNMYGLILLGIALIFGMGVRLASVFGVVLMLLYYVSDFVGNTAHGLIDAHLLYALLLLLMATGGFGHVFGIDTLLERRFHRSTWLKWILG